MRTVVIAPFSNSAIRDWPMSHFTRLITLLLDRLPDVLVHVVGVSNQRLAAREIVRPHPANRVLNQCGTLNWNSVLELIRRSDCMIGNNSGLSHIAGYLETPTVCVFGGSHQRMEWHPKGRNVAIVSRALACSPCQLDHNHISPYGKACLRGIEPEVVAEAAFEVMARSAKRASATASGGDRA